MNETNKRRLLGPRSCCLATIVCLVGGVALLILLAPVFWRRYEEVLLQSEIAEVKRSNTGRITIRNPEVIERLLQDPECREKVAEVCVMGDYTRDVSDKRFRSLAQFPHLKAVYLEYVGCVDTFLEGIQGAKGLEELLFHRAGVSEKGMRYVVRFPNLKRLSLDGRTNTACLRLLKGHAGIESLGLYEYQISPDRLSFIKSLPNLRKLSLELDLNGGVLDLHGLPKLNELNLANTITSDDELAGLEEMTSLTSLDLAGHSITDAGLVHLRNNQKLTHLSLMWQPITNAGLSHLSNLTSLEALNLCKTKITDAGLTHLKGLTALRKLDLSFTQVTDQGIKDLHRALPQCEIEAERNTAAH